MEEPELANMNREVGVSFIIGESSEVVEVSCGTEGGEEDVGVEADDMPNIAYAIPPLEDPKLAAKANNEIITSEGKKSC